jgi:hypothetical protein
MMSSEHDICYCACGCGLPTKIGRDSKVPNKFINGHNPIKLVQYIVQDLGYLTPCWIWQRALNIDGYGMKNRASAHRLYYKKFKGPIPEGLELDHLCHERGKCPGGITCPHRRCVNPDHLEPVASATNTHRGVQAKLNPSLVAELKRLRAQGISYREIGTLMGIADTTAWKACAGITWKV